MKRSAYVAITATVGRQEPDKSRGSRPVLGGRGGEIPLRYSTICTATTPSRSPKPVWERSLITTTAADRISRLTTSQGSTYRPQNPVQTNGASSLPEGIQKASIRSDCVQVSPTTLRKPPQPYRGGCILPAGPNRSATG